jgi:hypothetical protein
VLEPPIWSFEQKSHDVVNERRAKWAWWEKRVPNAHFCRHVVQDIVIPTCLWSLKRFSKCNVRRGLANTFHWALDTSGREPERSQNWTWTCFDTEIRLVDWTWTGFRFWVFPPRKKHVMGCVLDVFRPLGIIPSCFCSSCTRCAPAFGPNPSKMFFWRQKT